MKRILVVLIFFPVINFAQTAIDDSLFIHKIAVNILSSDAAYNNLFYLTKKIGGRLSGSANMYKAEQWGKKVLTDAGADNVIMQECMVPHWIRGGTDKTFVVYKNEDGKQQRYDLNVLALGNSDGSGPKGVTAPVVRVNNFDDLEAKKNELNGKIVFYNVPFDDTLINTFQAYGKNVIYRGIGASRAAKYGAVGMMMRSMSNTPGNYPHTGSMYYLDSIKRVPAVAMGLDDVKKLNSLLDKNISLTATIITNGKMLPDTIAHNVIGVLTGSEHPEQIITIGGHLDSWDPAEGANDDGTGIVQTLEILRVFKALHYQPKHTIHFVFFANEENGSRGGIKYAEAARQNNEQHIFALESDAGGFTPRGFGFECNDATWDKINNWKHFFTPYYGDRFQRGGDGEDIGYLRKIFGTITAGLIPDSQRYFFIHHAPSDVFENVDIREMKLGAINMAALIYLVDKYGL